RHGGRWVFRFQRREVAVPFLERELAVVPRIAKRLPLPVTVARWRGVMANGWPFGGYRFLDGDMAAIAGLSDAERLALAPAWGGFVRALHEIDPKAVGSEAGGQPGSARPSGVELAIDPLGKVDV